MLSNFLFYFCCCSKVTISLRYADLVSVLPTRVKVLAWPMHQLKKNHASSAVLSRKENGAMGSQPIPARLAYAEDALRTMSLPEGIAFTYPISYCRTCSC